MSTMNYKFRFPFLIVLLAFSLSVNAQKQFDYIDSTGDYNLDRITSYIEKKFNADDSPESKKELKFYNRWKNHVHGRLDENGNLTNYAARNHLREMRVGDLVLYYHSRKGLAVVGIARVIRDAYPDPTAEKGDWSVVDLVPVKAFHKAVSLKEIKATPALSEIPLVRIGRLSVMPIPKKAFDLILKMGETEL